MYETSTESVDTNALPLAYEWKNAEQIPIKELSWQIDDSSTQSPSSADDDSRNEGVSTSPNATANELGSTDDDNTPIPPMDVPQYKPMDLNISGLRRSRCSHHPVSRLNLLTLLGFVTVSLAMATTSTVPMMYNGGISLVLNTLRFQERVLSLDDATLNDSSPLSYATTLADSDTLRPEINGCPVYVLCSTDKKMLCDFKILCLQSTFLVPAE